MSRPYTHEEIQILMRQNLLEFSEAELNELLTGQASIKLAFKADKILEKHKNFMQKPMSRDEALNNFVTFSVFNQLNNICVVLKHVLVEKGLATEASLDKIEHELIAKQIKSLCADCINVYPACMDILGRIHKPKFTKEKWTDLEGELGEKVLECNNFQRAIQQGSC